MTAGTTKLFAPQYERTEQGWVRFPSDVAYRKRLPFPDRVFEHPAKANLYLLESVVDYVSVPGQTILDPFGGTGSILVATRMGRNVIMLEVEPGFAEIIDEAMYRFENVGEPVLTVAHGTAMLLRGDNRQLLPIPCDHVITSPPYASILQGTGLKENIGRSNSQAAMKAYSGDSASALNIGRLSHFPYAKSMEKVYQLLGKSVRPGGTMTILIKDRMKNGVREFLSEPCVRACTEAGFHLQDWFKWKAPGTGQQKLMKSKGFDVVEDEDIFIFERKQDA